MTRRTIILLVVGATIVIGGVALLVTRRNKRVLQKAHEAEVAAHNLELEKEEKPGSKDSKAVNAKVLADAVAKATEDLDPRFINLIRVPAKETPKAQKERLGMLATLISSELEKAS